MELWSYGAGELVLITLSLALGQQQQITRGESGERQRTLVNPWLFIIFLHFLWARRHICCGRTPVCIVRLDIF